MDELEFEEIVSVNEGGQGVDSLYDRAITEVEKKLMFSLLGLGEDELLGQFEPKVGPHL